MKDVLIIGGLIVAAYLVLGRSTVSRPAYGPTNLWPNPNMVPVNFYSSGGTPWANGNYYGRRGRRWGR